MKNNNKNKKECSFCKISEYDTSILVGDDNNEVFICLDCVNAIHDMSNQLNILENNDSNIEEQTLEGLNEKTFNLSPKDIKKELDEYVVGQEHAKKTISIAAYNHYKRVKYNLDDNNIKLDKSNILFIGPSGSGKTLIVETLANLLNVPFVIADATTLTEAGYVGDDVESILNKLLEKSNGNVEKAEMGIIFIDEIDKIASRNIEDRQNTRDVAGEGVQQSLLKILEGKEITLTQKKGQNNEKEITINTKNILFIGAGAFIGLEKIIEKRLNTKKVGFKNKNINVLTKEKTKFLKYTNTNDLINFGVIPEFLGRLPIITTLEELTDEEMLLILTKPKNSLINQFKILLNIDNINLKFEEEGLKEIVSIAKEKKLGARGLRSILDNTLHDIMFNLEEYKNKDIVIGKKEIIKDNIN